MTRVLRYEIPVDGVTHALTVGRVLHVAARYPQTVEIWTLEDDPTTRTFRVFATGESLPAADGGWTYVGTALVTTFVWHLFEMGGGA